MLLFRPTPCRQRQFTILPQYRIAGAVPWNRFSGGGKGFPDVKGESALYDKA